ncbi:two-component system sensor histidine kinase NtrB [Mesoterricola silvestris]|nr:ATP-binding protein [Mesoterricola silvestris]
MKAGNGRTLLLAATVAAVGLTAVAALENARLRAGRRDLGALRELFRESPVPVCILDRQGRVQGTWNPAAENRFGRTAAGAQGRPLPVFLPGGPEEAETLLGRAFRGEALTGIQAQGRPKVGPPFPLTLHLTPLRGREGRVEAMLVFLLDASEFRELREQLLHSQKLETAGALLSAVTHDVNNILVAILGCNELLLQDPLLTPGQKRRLETIHRGANRGHALAGRLLRYVRKAPQERCPTDLNELVQEVMALMGESAGPGLSVRAHLDPELPAPLVEPSEIHQVIMNLGANARDAMPGGGDLTFRTRLAEPGEAPGLPHPAVLLEVQDTGVGIPLEVRKRMFDPFFTTKPEGQGTGLGLAVVDRIVKSHGGHVRCTSRVGEGALFQVFLPVG